MVKEKFIKINPLNENLRPDKKKKFYMVMDFFHNIIIS